MSNILNFYNTFLVFVANLIGRQKTSYQSSIQLWCHDFSLFLFGETEEMTFNENWEQVYRAFAHFAYLKTYSLGL